jgi:hypothetical protein
MRACILALACAAQPLSAQTFEEAVWANASLAVQLCNAGQASGAVRAAWFRDAGFSERVDRSTVNSDTTHHFAAPSNTVAVELYYGEMPEHCVVETVYLGVTAGSIILDAVVPGMFPGFLRKVTTGPADPATGQPAQCVTYEDPANPIGLIIGVASLQNDTQGCTEDGTAFFYSSYRV